MQGKRKRMKSKQDGEGSEGGEKDPCLLCGSADIDEFRLGKKHKHEEIVAHYYCLLFACGLEQNGKDEEGIQGFLKKDILKEVARGKRLKCSFCRKPGATSACCLRQCRTMFHLGCGLKAKCLNQFYQDFSSFCVKHRPKQSISKRYLADHLQDECPICYMPIEVDQDPGAFGYLKTPCCNALLHRPCVQKQALSAGYFFKCPLCNNEKAFCKEMQHFGIYIPEIDASWELEENAFAELSQRYNKCDAENCECPDGRKYDKPHTQWDIAICCSCASHGAHVRCGNISETDSDSWICPVCFNIEFKSTTENPKKRKLSETTNIDESASSSFPGRIMSLKRVAHVRNSSPSTSPSKIAV
ncbi:G2/M phase-specific E3 ubiquitin-protein ligase-like [Panonychus citri]|uniref:G2/M phase-specific E3 ubiquitin-protein ligase-like n=1 Tax=Panonychus citri TaxID=50023 RepID=UPI0023074B3F|nr:G2/M phase-specific E3 ubiquitin-protein ligase-like [Panonychus citri]